MATNSSVLAWRIPKVKTGLKSCFCHWLSNIGPVSWFWSLNFLISEVHRVVMSSFSIKCFAQYLVQNRHSWSWYSLAAAAGFEETEKSGKEIPGFPQIFLPVSTWHPATLFLIFLIFTRILFYFLFGRICVCFFYCTRSFSHPTSSYWTWALY